MTEELPTWVNVRAEAGGDNDNAPAPRTASTKADLAAVFESLLVLFAADWRERRVVSARARRAKVRLFIISKPSWGVRRGLGPLPWWSVPGAVCAARVSLSRHQVRTKTGYGSHICATVSDRPLDGRSRGRSVANRLAGGGVYLS